MADFLAPGELSKQLVEIGRKKAALPLAKMVVLGLLAGVYIGFATHLATTVATGWTPETPLGLQKFFVGAVFSVGLMLVIIPGSELWTGNCLMSVALCARKITFKDLMRNWTIVYLANLVGSIVLALFIARSSGLMSGPVGGTALRIAVSKTAAEDIGGLSHNYAFFFRGIGANWLVCLAVMMAVSAKDITGKVFGIFFPIMAFVTSGFEHSIANMYFIPAGIYAKDFAVAVEASGLSAEALAGLNWTTMWTQNVIVVTLGNFVGGAVFTGAVYWWLFVREDVRQEASQGALAPAAVTETHAISSLPGTTRS